MIKQEDLSLKKVCQVLGKSKKSLIINNYLKHIKRGV